jgi:hypothetical protein
VASTAVIDQDGSINLDQATDCSVWVKASSSIGTPNLLVYYLCSPTNVDANFCVPEVHEELAITDENPHTTYISIPISRYIKIRVAGQAGNPADTIVSVIVQHS